MAVGLKKGMVFSSVKAPETYNEIIGIYEENGRKIVEIAQFSKTEDYKIVRFFEKELTFSLKRGLVYIVNNWASKN